VPEAEVELVLPTCGRSKCSPDSTETSIFKACRRLILPATQMRSNIPSFGSDAGKKFTPADTQDIYIIVAAHVSHHCIDASKYHLADTGSARNVKGKNGRERHVHSQRKSSPYLVGG